jgi:hypothetical protein
MFNFILDLICISVNTPFSMTAPRYRTTFGMGLTCNDRFSINGVPIQYDNNGNLISYYKCPAITNPTAGMATSTNNTNITKKMRYAQNIRVATETKNVKKVYAVNDTNRFGRWYGAPGGFGAPITNSF